jgi:quinol monooxygenase YgiN
MAVMIVQHQVKDYKAWKEMFDGALALRKKNGEVSATVYHDEKDPNKLTIVNIWDSMENAHKFAQSNDLKTAMEKGGVVGAPTIFFLKEA